MATDLARWMGNTRCKEAIELALPDVPEQLDSAERAHAEAVAAKEAADHDFSALNLGFDDFAIVRHDGTPFPADNRKSLLISLYEEQEAARKRLEAAARDLTAARRAAAAGISATMAPALDEIAAAIEAKIEAAVALFGLFERARVAARGKGLLLCHKRLEAFEYTARRLAETLRTMRLAK